MSRRIALAVLACSLCIGLAPQLRAQTLPDPTTIRFDCAAQGTVCSTGAVTLLTNNTLPTFNITIQGDTGLTPAVNSGSPTGYTATGELFLVILVPGTSSLSFSVNGIPAVQATANFPSGATTFTSASGTLFDHGTAFFAAPATSTMNPNFNAWASAGGQVITTPTAYTVYVVDLGAVSMATDKNGTTAGSTPLILAMIASGAYSGVGGFPLGTVFTSVLTCVQATSTTPCSAGGSLFSTSSNVVNSVPLSATLTITPEPGTLALFGTGLLALGGIVRARMRKNKKA